MDCGGRRKRKAGLQLNDRAMLSRLCRQERIHSGRDGQRLVDQPLQIHHMPLGRAGNIQRRHRQDCLRVFRADRVACADLIGRQLTMVRMEQHDIWAVVELAVSHELIVNGRVKVSQRAAQNVATLGLG